MIAKQKIIIEQDDFLFFQNAILKLCGISLTSVKKDLLQTRLSPRFTALGLDSLAAYRCYLEGLSPNHPEWQLLTNQITTNKTDFFRESTHFNYLVEKFLPKWKQHNSQKKLRIWSAACSTGEEAYSLAMVLDRYFRGNDQFEIIATDIDTKVLRHADNGVYHSHKLSTIPKEFHNPCLAHGTGDLSSWFRLSKRIQSRVHFTQRNLLNMPYSELGFFDIIFCRNVFIYFKPNLIQSIVKNFEQVINDEGNLFIGHSENLMQMQHDWISVSPSVFARKMSRQREPSPPLIIKKPRPDREHQQVKTREVSTLVKRRVLIVDDSATIRRLLTRIIETSPLLEVVASIANPTEVEEAIKKYRPDVMTLDIHMPELDGYQVLEWILPKYQIPIIMVSSLDIDQGNQVLKALEMGAFDYIQKPSILKMDRMGPQIVETILTATTIRVDKPKSKLQQVPLRRKTSHSDSEVIAIGSSTGGTQALSQILTRLPASLPPIVLVQHIPPVFSRALAERLNALCSFSVKEGQHGDELQCGHVYIAPGNLQMRVVRMRRNRYKLEISDEEPVNLHKPSVDVLFESVASSFGGNAIGIILTGMGADGARGLLQMKQSGAKTIAQNEESCVVFGMPKEAIRLGAADNVCSLETIPEKIMSYIDSDKRKQK